MSKGAKPPDLTKGIALVKLGDGAMIVGHAKGEPVLLARRGGELFAVSAHCTHHGAPLSDGLLVDDTVRCPWHHACFSLRTGEALRAPALKPVTCWHVEQRNGKAFVGKKIRVPAKQLPPATDTPKRIVIVGGGAAGNAAAEMLRREGYTGRITMLSADAAVPVDRPRLSKSFLAGTARASQVPLRSRAFYTSKKITLKLNARVASIDTGKREVRLESGAAHAYDRLLLATGADPVRLPVPGAELPHVHYLRTFADSRALITAAKKAKHAVVIGASFIGLEAAASLRTRNVPVHVVAPEAIPMERILGADTGKFIRRLHEEHGVIFHLENTAVSIDERSVTLKSGERLPADLVVIGVGVRAQIALAEHAGIAIDKGVSVNEYLETSAPGVFAAGDIARWPDPLTGERIRVEHWVVAERQGQTAARNMLGKRERFTAVPFFWSEHYDIQLGYVGHAEQFDRVDFDGTLEARDCTITYYSRGKKLAVAVIQRDLAGLRAELSLERSAGATS
jgi:NADPH-dependent 2,4-dienoyl-CoA reductase/sulfur reductase-like enzyme/nitrite reductase/ring-hydroxylating ferredoxin subunit